MQRFPLSGRLARGLLFVSVAGLLAGCLVNGGPTTTKVDLPPSAVAADPVLARIRDEGLNRSKAPETIDYLCNVIGPRLTASPGMHAAAGWTRETLSSWGLANAHLETWGPFGRGWSLRRFNMQVIEPTVFNVNAFPKAWSPGFDEPLEAEVIYVDAKTEAGLAKYKGKLKGKIVLLGEVRDLELPLVAPATRHSDEYLARLATSQPTTLPTPPSLAADAEPTTAPTTVPADDELLKPQTGPTTAPATGPASTARQLASARTAARMFSLVARESPALILTPTSKGDGGILFVAGAALPTDPLAGGVSTTGPSTKPTPWAFDAPKIPPQVVLAGEDFNRLARIARRGVPIKIRTELQVQFHDGDGMVPNVIAEIPGTDLAHEVVMVGAHLDSWHAGTGATDNAIGSVAAMEAVRIIKALDLKPRRTIRIALWTGEEQGLFGSSNYVKEHFGRLDDPTTQPSTSPTTRSTRRSSTTRATTRRASTPTLVKGPDYEKLSAYFNLDNGCGRIRGIYCQGNEAAMPIFKQWIAPFADLDAKTVTLANTGGTDHLSFDRIGLPGFQFIQDPMDYRTRTHHSNQDNFDRIQTDDLKQASTIMAWFVWKAANEPERFPRKPLPNVRGR